jgi:hypothetical protein
MQILKGSDERVKNNPYADTRPDLPTYSLDKQVAFREAHKLMPTNFSEWKDADGSVFSTLGELENYQAIKFCNRYPPNFVRNVRPELAMIEGTKISWSLDAVKINMKDAYTWSLTVRQIEDMILKWAHFDFEKFKFDENLTSIKKAAVDAAIEMFYAEYRKLTKEVK